MATAIPADLLLDDAQRAKIAKAYDSPSWWYDLRGFFILTFTYRATLWEQLRLFAAAMGREHLEVAIGSGTLFAMILRRARRLGRAPERVVGFDYAERMLAGAVRRFAGDPALELSLGDATRMRFADASFDSVAVANALHCIPDAGAALAEMHRVLRPGGRLAANVLLHPRGGWPWRPLAERINRWGMAKGILHRPYAEAEIRALVEGAGFRIERAWVSGNAWNVVAVKPG